MINYFYATQGTIGATSSVTTQRGFYVDTSFTGATNNYGFFSEIASGTGRYNFYAAGTATNYFEGSMFIGGVLGGDTKFAISGTAPSAGGGSYANRTSVTFPSAATAGAVGFDTSLSTTAAAYTLSNLFHYNASQSTIGAGSAVTNQYGFTVQPTLIGATNNYGFYGNIASGTGRWNFYAAGTADNYFAGSVGIGSTALTAMALRTSKSITGGTSAWGIRYDGAVLSDVTAAAYLYSTYPSTQAAAFTLGNLLHYQAGQGTLGAGSSIGNQYGFYAGSDLVGATNNFGFLSNIASGTGRFNFYAAGTAANVFVGTTSLGGVVGSESLRVTPVASAVNYINAQGNVTAGNPSFQAAGSDTNIGLNFSSKGNSGNLFYTNGLSNLQFVVGHTASAVNYLQVSGAATAGVPYISAQGADTNISLAYTSKGTAAHYFYSNNFGSLNFSVAHTASAVDYIQATGSSAGFPNFSAAGSSTNITIVYGSKGTGGHNFTTNGTSTNQFVVAHTATAVNYLQVTGGIATTGFPIVSAQGSDTNIDLALTPKGTGNVRFGTLTANADAPITGYILIKDSGGTTRKLAVIA
jgi:hypothetical protein